MIWPFDKKRREYEQRLTSEAAKLIGVRFLMNGRVPSQGLDCLGLVVYLQRAAGVPDFPDADHAYPGNWHLHEHEELYLKGLQEHSRPVETPAQLKVGDVVCFRLGVIFPNLGSMRIQHAGLVIDPVNLKFIHAIGGRGVTYSTLGERAWSMCLAAMARPLTVLAYLGEA